MPKNQNGFGLIEGLLVVIAITLIGFTGFYVYNANKNANKSLNQDSSTVLAPEKKQAEGLESDSWKLVESSNKAFKIRVADGWKLNNDSQTDLIWSSFELDSSDLVYKKGQPAVITKEAIAGTDAPLRFVASVSDEKPYNDPSSQNSEFKLHNGISGTKSYHLEQNEQEGLGPIKGQKTYTYEFEKNGKYYSVRYLILPGDSDNLATVEKVVKTLDF